MPDLYPLDDPWTEADDERFLAAQERSSPLTPEADFDEWFELWQSVAEDGHMRQALATLEAQGRRMLAQETANDEAGVHGAGPRR